MSSKKDSALAKVQNLYAIQVELWAYVDRKELDSEQEKYAKKKLKEYKDLLKEVDVQFLGGEDVMESLQWLPEEVQGKLKKPTKPKKPKSPRKKARK